MSAKCPSCESSNVSYIEGGGLSALGGAAAGAALGSVIPVIGTGVGAVAGFLGGLAAGSNTPNLQCLKCGHKFKN
jgi:uncharacterized membrane protein